MDAPGLEDRQPVGFLRRFSYAGVPEKDFLLYPGLNMIGRKSDSAVILPFPFISRLHAFIEISFRTRKPLLSDFGPVEKDQRLNGRDGNSDSDADVSEQKNFDQ
ncbi:mediator of DNA damage checkpoint protein 1-like isoform X3 [Macrotis lagotis]|uniref:mediator of DNA damage checkpoint protein 1-like isoform X3 n=1 Tax=Macrotis lagotis TaxID=92651 RepID=UPI003D69085D